MPAIRACLHQHLIPIRLPGIRSDHVIRYQGTVQARALAGSCASCGEMEMPECREQQWVYARKRNSCVSITRLIAVEATREIGCNLAARGDCDDAPTFTITLVKTAECQRDAAARAPELVCSRCSLVTH